MKQMKLNSNSNLYSIWIASKFKLENLISNTWIELEIGMRRFQSMIVFH